MLLYYITDRSAFPGDENSRRHQLLEKISGAARSGVDFIQLREKDLSSRELESMATAALQEVRKASPTARLLINTRTDLALAVGADGVHLRANDISPKQVRAIFASQTRNLKLETRNFIVAVSCHSVADVAQAALEGADFAVFAPVFEKKGSPSATPTGLEALGQACRHKLPVLALGGVTPENARSCIDAGAAGIAGIRLFQKNDIHEVVSRLK